MTDELTPVHCGCGGEAVLETDHDTIQPIAPIDWKRVRCNKCNIRTTWRRSEALAIEAWNRAMAGSTEKSSVVERTAKVEEVEKPNVFKCGECGQYFHSTAWGSPVEYCSRCGARLEWEHENL